MKKIYLLNNQKYKDVENIEIFKIEFLKPEIDLSNIDALIFTSKNAVLSLDSLDKSWRKIPSYVIAKKTANVVEKHNGKIEFIGKSAHGNDFANELKVLLKNKKTLYIRAEKVVSNLVNILKDNSIDVEELITYKTVCNDSLNKKIEDDSIIIFTSPSSVECFFKKYEWNTSLKAVVIGQTTAKYLPNYVNFKVSEKTSVEECIKLARVANF